MYSCTKYYVSKHGTVKAPVSEKQDSSVKNTDQIINLNWKMPNLNTE